MYSFFRSVFIGLSIASSLSMLQPALADAENPVKVWEISGLMDPESALYDSKANVLYISNMEGSPTVEDGKGYISRADTNGKILDERWVDGLHAPKGMALVGNQLYVSDLNRVLVINTTDGSITRTHPVPDANFLNDAAAGEDGMVYVSDMGSDTIYRIKDGKLRIWLTHPDLHSPNGLLVVKNKLIVGSWGGTGTDRQGDGKLLSVNMVTMAIKPISRQGLGHLDGIVQDIDGDYYVTDWVSGQLLHVEGDGSHGIVMEFNQGAADLGYVPGKDLLLVPLMKDGRLEAYKMHN